MKFSSVLSVSEMYALVSRSLMWIVFGFRTSSHKRTGVFNNIEVFNEGFANID